MIPNPGIERRREALEAIGRGERTHADVAREFGVTRQAVGLWVKRFEEYGAVVGARRQTTRLSAQQKSEFREIVENRAPSDFGIESEDDSWHWLELHDLLFDRVRRRFPRKECMQMLTAWGVPNPDISKERKRAQRHRHEPSPVSRDESAELMQLLEVARERMAQEKAQAVQPVAGSGVRQGNDAKQRAKLKEKQRRKQKLAQKQKQKQKRKQRRKR